MNRKLLLSFILLSILSLTSYVNAQGLLGNRSDSLNVELSNGGDYVFSDVIPYPAQMGKEFQFYAYFFTQGVTSNFFPNASVFQGQLVGRLFGGNSSITAKADTAMSAYVEQRLLPMFVYQPKIFNNKVILRASFEIDFTWGDVAYMAGGNRGGAISGDQVNIQTQNVEVEYMPNKFWAINLGLQRLYDTPFNPYRTILEKMTSTSYRLAYWGTDAVGITVRNNTDYNNFKTGYYKLYENQQHLNDDVTLFEVNYRRKLSDMWNAGASVYAIIDRAKSQGGVSSFRQGLTSTLAAYNGAYRFNFGTDDYTSDVFWFGGYFSRNPDLIMDRLMLTGFFNYNYGYANVNYDNAPDRKVNIGGFAFNSRAAYKYGNTINDYVALDFLYTTGDANGIKDDNYQGVMTGNTWGMPANVFIGSGAYLLFPSINVVNRYTPAVMDISNMGYGLIGGTANIHKDIIPHRLNAKVGTAMAMSVVAPQNGGYNLGAEINTGITYQLGAFMSVEFHAAYLKLGDFYDSNDKSHGSDVNSDFYTVRPPDPWTAFVVYKWLIF